MSPRNTDSIGTGTSPGRFAGPPDMTDPSMLLYEHRDVRGDDREPPLTKKQRDFVRECIDTQRPLADVMDDHKITPERFATWMNKRGFRRHLERMCRCMRKAREFDIACGARRAAELLRRNINADRRKAPLKRPEQIKAGVELIRFARASERRRLLEVVKQPHIPDRPLIHPDVSLEEGQRLLKLMDDAANS